MKDCDVSDIGISSQGQVAQSGRAYQSRGKVPGSNPGLAYFLLLLNGFKNILVLKPCKDNLKLKTLY